MVECKHFNNDLCGIASNLAGADAKTDAMLCGQCAEEDAPRQINPVTISVALAARRSSGQDYKDILIKYRNHLKVGGTQSTRPVGMGPGTELKEIVPKFFKSSGCQCNNYAAQMDKWGVEGCEEKFDQIVEYLVKQARGWAIPAFASKPMASRWLRMAIENAKKDWPFVWTYYAPGAKGDELKYSIRSVLKWYPNARVIVVGDKPDWYTGEFIEKPRIGNTDFRAFKDCYSKILRAAEEVDKFIWMMDDVYLASETPLWHLTSPKYVRHVTQEKFYAWKPKNAWAKTRANAYAYLLSKSLPTYDFAAHLPQPIRSSTLLQMEKELKLMNNYMNWECVYFNTYYSQHAIGYGKKYTRVHKTQKDGFEPKHPIMNHTDSQYLGPVKSFLESTFPEKCGVEA